MSIPTYTHTHPLLGALTGRLLHPPLHNIPISESPETIHFRSVPFASIPGRFKPSIQLDKIPTSDNDSHDFTNYTFACPQIPQPRESYGGTLPEEEDRRYDEYSCLNLTLSVPKTALATTSKALPVMVYIHGGAWSEGAGHISALHDTSRMAALSALEDTPVIFASIGYRLNWFGFLNSHDLIEEAVEEDGSSNRAFNVGLQDQITALRWLRRNIAGFGGDADQITVFGESAGSGSIAMLLCQDEKLFNRAVMQSGNLGVVPSTTLEEQDGTYQNLLKFLGIEADTRQERLKLLRAVPAEMLVAAISGLNAAPFKAYMGPGNAMFRARDPSYANQCEIIASCPWVEDVMLGDTHLEGYANFAGIRKVEQGRFVDDVRGSFGEEHAEKLFKLYGIDPHRQMDKNLFWYNCMQFWGDVAFSEPTEAMANALVGSVYTQGTESKTRKVYRYHLAISNAIPGSEFSYVVGHHFVDLMYQFMTVTERYPRHRDSFFARQAQEFARKWICFGTGRAPWEEYGNGKIAVLDDLRGWEIRTRESDRKMSESDPWGERRYEHMKAITDAFEAAGLDEKRGGTTRKERIDSARRKVIHVGM